jgi:hypothetical protein
LELLKRLHETGERQSDEKINENLKRSRVSSLAPWKPLNNVHSWVARWFVFKPKIQIWVNFGGSCDERCWSFLWPFGQFDVHLAIFCGFLVYFMVIWYIFPVCKINLATLVHRN